MCVQMGAPSAALMLSVLSQHPVIKHLRGIPRRIIAAALLLQKHTVNTLPIADAARDVQPIPGQTLRNA